MCPWPSKHPGNRSVNPADRGTFHMLRAELALEEGRPGDAYDDVKLALAQAASTDDYEITCEICTLGLRALADQRDAARQGHLRFDEDNARLLGGELTEKAETLVDRQRQRGMVPLPRAEALALQCRAEATRLSVSEATSWERAAERWERLGERYNVAYCLMRQAEALLATRSAPVRAATCLRRAWGTSVELGATASASQDRAIAQRARVPFVTATPDPPHYIG